MISGGGRSHGSQAIGDGLIRCPKTLPQIKKRLSSSDPEITPRARPAEIAMVVSYTDSHLSSITLCVRPSMITLLTRSGVLQAIVEKERLKTKELVEEAKGEAQREAEEREREMEERTAKLLEEERNQNDSTNRALYKLTVVRFSCILAQSCT